MTKNASSVQTESKDSHRIRSSRKTFDVEKGGGRGSRFGHRFGRSCLRGYSPKQQYKSTRTDKRKQRLIRLQRLLFGSCLDSEHHRARWALFLCPKLEKVVNKVL